MGFTNRRGLSSHRVIIGDSRDMGEIESESVQLVVTSPPYPMIEMWDPLFSRLDTEIATALSGDGGSDADRAYGLMHNQLLMTFKECARILGKGGVLCVNIGDAARKIGGMFRLFPNHATIMEDLRGLGLVALPYILWKKPTNKPNAFLGSGFIPTNAYVTLDCEFIIIMRKGGPRRFVPKDESRYRSAYTRAERDSWFSQVWEGIHGTNQRGSDANSRTGAFPIEIPRRLIRMFSVIGDTVVDPFMGTGTTLLAARETDRNFVGFELNPDVIPKEILQGDERLIVVRRGDGRGC